LLLLFVFDFDLGLLCYSVIATLHPIHNQSRYAYQSFSTCVADILHMDAMMQHNMISYLKMYYSSLSAPALVGESLGFSLVIFCML
jgi:hypothetical protein